MISKQQISALQGAFNYFNNTLFGGELESPMFNFVWSKKSHGHVGPKRWVDRDGEMEVHELSLTPNTLSRDVKDVYGTLVHEMCHIWQIDHGNPSRSGYHNKEWANKMLEVGLIPSATGQPGGKQTGQKMTHYIEQGGKFDEYFTKMPEKLIIPFIAHAPVEVSKKRSNNKKKYTCEHGDSFWAKPGMHAVCTECGTKFVEQ